MNATLSPTMLITPEHILWVKDQDKIIVIDKQQKRTLYLQDLEAALWSWLTLAYPYQKLIYLLQASLDTTTQEAEKQLISFLQKWHSAGILVLEGGKHG